MPGRVLGGRYQVQDKVGTGGMATVFRGTDEVLGRTVAIKTMLPQYASDPSFAARFKQEAQAAAALQSPYIVSIFDWGKDADTYYIVMEYIRGTDLKSGIRKHGALDCKKVAQIGSQIAQALSVAHKHDIIHRDIKPQNIMVQPDGNIKVMDFGIARAKNSHLTTDNSVLGTAHYVSPEQTQGKELGPTTDIYSLGIVMYESATGRVPFDGDDAISVALKQVNEQPIPPSQLNPAVDPSLESIILKCMQKNPADRFQSADELYRVLRDYLSGRYASVNAATSVLPQQQTASMSKATSATATLPLDAQGKTQRTSHMSAMQQAEEEEEERRHKRRNRIVAGVVAGIVLVAVIGYAVYSLLNSGTKMATVPNLANLTEEEAVAAIEDAGFTVGSIEETYSDTVEEGYVVDQTPSAYTERAEGSEIDIYISMGPTPAATVTVPDLTGMTVEEAEEALSAVGLIGKQGTSEYSDSIDEDLVSSQDTVAGSSASEGDTVIYHVSKGVETVTVPSVLGSSRSSAVSTLEDLGLTVNVVEDYSSSYSEGKVCAQSYSSGSIVSKGSTITITVSLGEEDTSVTVPTISSSMTVEEAESAIANAGLRYDLQGRSSDTVSEGYVISISPSSGSSVDEGSTITIYYSTGPASDITDNVDGGNSDTPTTTE